jgi:hypothetical protein
MSSNHVALCFETIFNTSCVDGIHSDIEAGITLNCRGCHHAAYNVSVMTGLAEMGTIWDDDGACANEAYNVLTDRGNTFSDSLQSRFVKMLRGNGLRV